MAKKKTVKKKVGQPKKIATPEIFYKYFEEYKNHSYNNPVEKMDFKGKDADKVTYKITRPLSWLSFRVWLYKNKSISFTTVDNYQYNKDEGYNEYVGIIRVIDGEIFTQQYDGAAAGVYQQNIIARRLGLVEKAETKTEVTIKETKIGFSK